MGKVFVKARIENVTELFMAEQGLLKPEEVHAIEVTEAVVDTAASTLSLPKRLVAQLGLRFVGNRNARTSAGRVTFPVYGTVRLTIEDRLWSGDVIEVPDECPVLIGQLPLEGLDYVVDPVNHRLIGNPDHGGEYLIELY
jgi:predicted aspartyl protease